MPDLDCLKKVVLDPKTNQPKKRKRTTRPHEWTYRTNTRLETVVKDAYEGLLTYAQATGRLWGGSLPKHNNAEMIDAIVLR